MSGGDHKKSLYHIKFGNRLIDHPQSVRMRGLLVLKTILSESELDRQNQLKNHENNKN